LLFHIIYSHLKIAAEFFRENETDSHFGNSPRSPPDLGNSKAQVRASIPVAYVSSKEAGACAPALGYVRN